MLTERSESIWTKGSFDTAKLVDHVVRALGDTPIKTRRAVKTEAKSARDDTGDTDDTGAHSILIIDDDPRDLRLARRLIETGGNYHIIEASTGRDGLKAAYQHRPELIILDLIMPDMDGFTILETLQNDDELRGIPVVVFSAKNLLPSERERLQQRICTLMEKSSFDRKQFLDIIEEALKTY